MSSSRLACNLEAIGTAQRPRYSDLLFRVRAAMRERSELPDGYGYLLDSANITHSEASEWIALEHLCCSFLIFQFDADSDALRLRIRGPAGSKAILKQEFTAGLKC